jgi:hypothetical protein
MELESTAVEARVMVCDGLAPAVADYSYRGLPQSAVLVYRHDREPLGNEAVAPWSMLED